MKFDGNFKNCFRFGKIIFILMIIILFLFISCTNPKVYKVGILSGLGGFLAGITDGFKDQMKTLGYEEGKNIIYDVQQTDFDMAKYQTIIRKFIDDKVDLIIAYPTEATMEAKKIAKGTDIPVVFTFALIEDMGIVDSIREPGGNITGVRYPGPDIALKRLEILRKIVPGVKRIVIPYQKGYPIVVPQMNAIKTEAAASGLTLIEVPAADAVEAGALLQEQKATGMDAIMFLAEPLAVTADSFVAMAKFAYDNKIPLGGAYMKVGDYASIYGINVEPISSGKAVAPLADKILKGTPAGTIPVVSAESFMQIDVTAAQKLGVVIPDDILKQAAEVLH